MVFSLGKGQTLFSLKSGERFFLCSLAVVYRVVRYFLNFCQNYMDFWPQTSGYFVERDLSNIFNFVKFCSAFQNNSTKRVLRKISLIGKKSLIYQKKFSPINDT